MYMQLALITPQIIPLKCCLLSVSLLQFFRVFTVILYYALSHDHTTIKYISSQPSLWPILPAFCSVFTSSIYIAPNIILRSFTCCFRGSHLLCTIVPTLNLLYYFLILCYILYYVPTLLFLIIHSFIIFITLSLRAVTNIIPRHILPIFLPVRNNASRRKKMENPVPPEYKMMKGSALKSFAPYVKTKETSDFFLPLFSTPHRIAPFLILCVLFCPHSLSPSSTCCVSICELCCHI